MSKHNRERRRLRRLVKTARAKNPGFRPEDILAPPELVRIRRHGKRRLAKGVRP